ncbi:MAG: hypothetical protein QM286_09885 [Acidobacteriota bacterium]|nr:hypothetical protein [Acidobacteriota bacterium]
MTPTLTPPRERHAAKHAHSTPWETPTRHSATPDSRDYDATFEVYRGAITGFNGLRIVQRWRCDDTRATTWDCLLANGALLYRVAPQNIVTRSRTALLCGCCLRWAAEADDFDCRYFQGHGEADHPDGLCGSIGRGVTPIYDGDQVASTRALDALHNCCDGCGGYVADEAMLYEVTSN